MGVVITDNEAMNEIQIRIKGDELRFIYSDDLITLLDHGKHETKRASHVEPSKDGWSADMSPVGGALLGPFTTRNQALSAEVDWLYKHNIPKAR